MSDNAYSQSVTANGTLWHLDELTFNSVLAMMPWTKIGYGDLNDFTPITATVGMPTQLLAGSAVIGAVTQSGTWTVTVSSCVVTNAGTFAVQDSQVIADNAGFTDGTSKVFMAGYVYDETAGTALTENDAAAGRINVNRAIVHTIEDGSTRGRYATVTAANALKTDPSGVTQPISASALPLPSGASTAAKQPALGTAGTASADVITVQGIASMTALKVDGSAVTQPVSGTVTANAGSGTFTVSGAVTQSGTWTVQPGNTANTTAWLVTGTGGTFPATQSGTWNVGTVTTITNVVHIDDNSSSITVDGTVTASIAAGATTIAKAEDVASADADVGVPAMAVRKASPANTSGTDGDYEMLQMSAGRLWTSATVDAALPAGTNAIGKLASNSGVTIGAVELAAAQTLATVTTITNVVHVDDNSGSLTVDGTVTASIAAGATTIAKAEDAASADADVGVPAMAVRKATPANTSGTDGDYEMLQMSAGRLWVSAVVDTALPAGTNAIGKLSSNSGVTIGAVEIASSQTLATVTNVATIGTSVTPGTGAAHLGKAEDAAHSDGDTGVMMLAVRKDTAAALAGTTGDYIPLTTNSTGYLWVDASGQTLTVASHAVTNAGTFAVQESGTQVQVDDAAFTPATSKVMMVGFEADESSTDSVDEGDGGAARMTLDRKQIVTVQPHTQGGLSTFMASGSDGSTILSNSAQVIKASAGQLYGYYIYNANSSATYVHFYNTAAASVTVGTTNPLFSLCIPATAAANLMFPNGVAFSNAGWSMAATTTAGGNTAPSTGIEAVVWYY